MRIPIFPLQCLLVFFIMLELMHVAGALANPHDYPQFARQKVQDDVPMQFIQAAVVKKRLEDHTPQVIVDVRWHSSYARAHLPGAISIPLRELPYRAAEIPRDLPVVLY